MIEKAIVWAWDARPFSAFPSRSDVWSDGENWSFGHWLNGRTGLSPLAQVIDDLSSRAGLEIDTSPLTGIVEGIAYKGILRLDDAMEPLAIAFDLVATESDAGLRVGYNDAGEELVVEMADLISDPKLTRQVEQGLAGRLHLSHAGLSNDFQIEVAEARLAEGDMRNVLSVELPLVFSEPEAARVAARLLRLAHRVTGCEIAVSGLAAGTAVGAMVDLEGETWTVSAVQRGLEERLALRPRLAVDSPLISLASPQAAPVTSRAIDPDLLVIDGLLPDDAAPPAVAVAVYADPWGSPVAISAGSDVAQLVERATAEAPSLTGRLLAPLAPGPVHRWDEGNVLDAEFAFSGLGSVDALGVLDGENTLLVETDVGWECLGFRDAELLGSATYRLSGLLRGLKGTEAAAETGALVGARCVLLDASVKSVSLSSEDIGRTLVWRAGEAATPHSVAFVNRAAWPLRPAHAEWDQASGKVTWIPRDRRIPDNWEVPDPVLDLFHELEWRLSDATLQVTQYTEPEAIAPVGGEPVRVRSVNRDGWRSDWVSIRAR